MSITYKEALGIRGRFGADVWEQWKQLPADKQTRFVRNYGVQEERVQGTVEHLHTILEKEGI